MVSFFEHQDEARRNTRWLVFLMGLGVLALTLCLYFVFLVFQGFMGIVPVGPSGELRWVDPTLLFATFAGTLAIVGVASGARVLSLRGGGRSVAEMLGGRLVSGRPQDELERRLLNVVEEMSLASGVPVPQVFVLDNEPGINAFAAGYTLDDAVIAVTRGCLESLTRDELQGVIAHEFSHILNGDMRLNLHIMGIVFGIVCIGLLGRFLMRVGSGGRGHARRRSGSSGASLVALGLGIFLVGLVGEFFGKLIKAAVSRQREFLADASAVQFTRNPAGIAGALKKIAGHGDKSRVRAARAEEASHFFFGDIHTRSFMSALFSSHPPLEERIRRLDPSFAPAQRTHARSAEARMSATASPLAQGLSAGAPRAREGAASVAPRDSYSALVSLPDHVGTLTTAAIDEGRRLLETLPQALTEAAQSSFSACAGVYALLLSEHAETRAKQLDLLEARAGAALAHETRRLWPEVRALARPSRLPFVELLAPALRELSASQRTSFGQMVQALIDADRRMSVFEYVLAETLRRRLALKPAHARAHVAHKSLRAVHDALSLTLSVLAHAGSPDASAAERAFAAARARLPQLGLTLLPRDRPLLSALSEALERLSGLAPSWQEAVVEACAEAVLSDHQVTDDELCLVRAVCDALGCPLPSRLMTQPASG